MRLRLFIATLTAVVCLAVPASSFAQSLSNDVYSSQAGQVLATAGSDETTPPAGESAPAAGTVVPVSESSSGTLPFTGFQAGIVALVGTAMLGAGLLLWRVNRRPGDTH